MIRYVSDHVEDSEKAATLLYSYVDDAIVESRERFAEALVELPEGPIRNLMIAHGSFIFADRYPDDARSFLSQLEDEFDAELSVHIAHGMIGSLATQDPAATMEWVDEGG